MKEIVNFFHILIDAFKANVFGSFKFTLTELLERNGLITVYARGISRREYDCRDQISKTLKNLRQSYFYEQVVEFLVQKAYYDHGINLLCICNLFILCFVI